MKSKNGSQYLIAVAVIVCSAILLAAMTFALTGFHWSESGRSVEIDFQDATSIKRRSPVRYAGAVAGSVIRIRYLTAEERRGAPDSKVAVRVTVQLQKETPRLPADVIAALASENILGEKFISLSAGSAVAAPLPEGVVIQGQGMVSFDSLARSARDAADNVNEMLAKLNSDYPNLIPRLQSLLSQGHSLLLQSSNLIHHADGAVTNAGEVVAGMKADYPQLVTQLGSLLTRADSLATNADSAISQVNGLVARADRLIATNEGDVAQLFGELRVVSQNLKVISTYTKALTATLGEKPSRLIWGIHKNKLPSEQEILESPTPTAIGQVKK